MLKPKVELAFGIIGVVATVIGTAVITTIESVIAIKQFKDRDRLTKLHAKTMADYQNNNNIFDRTQDEPKANKH